MIQLISKKNRGETRRVSPEKSVVGWSSFYGDREAKNMQAKWRAKH